MQRSQRTEEQTIGQRKSRQLRHRRNKQRDRGRCAVIDIRHPHVERGNAQLESHAGDDKDQAEQQQDVSL